LEDTNVGSPGSFAVVLCALIMMADITMWAVVKILELRFILYLVWFGIIIYTK
jgi:hypothetical protein